MQHYKLKISKEQQERLIMIMNEVANSVDQLTEDDVAQEVKNLVSKKKNQSLPLGSGVWSSLLVAAAAVLIAVLVQVSWQDSGKQELAAKKENSNATEVCQKEEEAKETCPKDKGQKSD